MSQSVMTIGEFISPLGDKNRIALPKKLRSALGESLVLTRGYERSLILVDQTRWQNLLSVINQQPLLALDVRDTKRFLLGGAFELDLDNQSRFVIPEALIQYAGIGDQVVFLGLGEWVEIWDQQRWQEHLHKLSSNAGEIADRLTGIQTENNIKKSK